MNATTEFGVTKLDEMNEYGGDRKESQERRSKWYVMKR